MSKAFNNALSGFCANLRSAQEQEIIDSMVGMVARKAAKLVKKAGIPLYKIDNEGQPEYLKFYAEPVTQKITEVGYGLQSNRQRIADSFDEIISDIDAREADPHY